MLIGKTNTKQDAQTQSQTPSENPNVVEQSQSENASSELAGETNVVSQEATPQNQTSVAAQTNVETNIQPNVQTKKQTHNDRISELEGKIAKMEAIFQLQGQNVVDMEVCTDLLMKGYTLEQLKQSKPYLFSQQQVQQQIVKQPTKIVAETQIPKPQTSMATNFVDSLAKMLISKF